MEAYTIMMLEGVREMKEKAKVIIFVLLKDIRLKISETT